MRLMIQRVARASVKVGDSIVSEIGPGLLVLLGVEREDQKATAQVLADKTANLRIFADEKGNMNTSLLDMGGKALVVSQFTLCADCRRGRRPSWHLAAPPELGRELYEEYCRRLEGLGIDVKMGVFGAMMAVELVNEGPVTIVLDSKELG